MNRSAEILITTLLCVIAMACTTVKHRPIAGRDIDLRQVEQIIPEQTTKADLEDLLGAPERVIKKDDGSEEYRYSYVGFVDRKMEALVYMRKETEKETKLLRVALQDDVVSGITYTNSLNPDENISK